MFLTTISEKISINEKEEVMKKMFLLGIFLAFVISCSSFAAITYSGPQNITVDLSNSAIIDFDGAGTIWYPFTISLQDMTSGSQTYRTLFYDVIGNTLIFNKIYVSIPDIGMEALNFGFADPIPPTPYWSAVSQSYLTAVDLSTLAVSGDFNPATPSGYIGVLGVHDVSGTLNFYHGWLHISNITDFGLSTMQATIDGWAYEDQDRVPIAAGAIPAPGAFILSIFGAGMVAYLRKRITI